MSGRQHQMTSTGANYEHCVRHFLGAIASVVHVPREQDFGIDFYCQPRVPAGPRTETVTELGAIQVKGGSAALTFGGLTDKGEWREYEFTWLRSLATPLFLAQVNPENTIVDLYSVWRLWWIFLSSPQIGAGCQQTDRPSGVEMAAPRRWSKAGRHPFPHLQGTAALPAQALLLALSPRPPT
jgi:hypothetical protein